MDPVIAPLKTRVEHLPESIGVCLSGGGFRAAAFHLGTLAYLHRVGLLPNVKLISTVSGGTFTGAKYAVSLVNHQPFDAFFRDYYTELSEPRIFTEALRLLSSETPLPVPSKRKKLITCAAQSYSTTLFARDPKNRTDPKPYLLGDLYDGTTAPLTEICFNSTDFRRGLAFRFQGSATGKNGNGPAEIDRSSARLLRLGDIVAASSCFPGGFEPLEFPNDFAWPGDSVPAVVKQKFDDEPTALMDGGVYDNQGLESLLLADDRQRSHHPASDLFIISDTDRKSQDLYNLPASLRDQTKSPWLKLLLKLNPPLWTLDLGTGLLHVLCALTFLTVTANLCARGWRGESLLTSSVLLMSIVPLLLALFASMAAGAVRSFFKGTLLPLVPELGSDSWQLLQHVRLSPLLDMLNARLTSMMALTMDVFMKRIRSVGFDGAFKDEKLAGRLMPNYIYHLSDEHGKDFFQKPDKLIEGRDNAPPELLAYLKTIPQPSALVENLSRDASQVGTKLWFDGADEQALLVAAGQVTTCFNLMKFVARTRKFDPATNTFTGLSGALWDLLLKDWRAFQTDPRLALRELRHVE